MEMAHTVLHAFEGTLSRGGRADVSGNIETHLPVGVEKDVCKIGSRYCPLDLGEASLLEVQRTGSHGDSSTWVTCLKHMTVGVPRSTFQNPVTY